MKIEELQHGMEVFYHGYAGTIRGIINFIDVEKQHYVTLAMESGCNVLIFKENWKLLARIDYDQR
jgi:hypothetical protein